MATIDSTTLLGSKRRLMDSFLWQSLTVEDRDCCRAMMWSTSTRLEELLAAMRILHKRIGSTARAHIRVLDTTRGQHHGRHARQAVDSWVLALRLIHALVRYHEALLWDLMTDSDAIHELRVPTVREWCQYIVTEAHLPPRQSQKLRHLWGKRPCEERTFATLFRDMLRVGDRPKLQSWKGALYGAFPLCFTCGEYNLQCLTPAGCTRDRRRKTDNAEGLCANVGCTTAPHWA